MTRSRHENSSSSQNNNNSNLLASKLDQSKSKKRKTCDVMQGNVKYKVSKKLVREMRRLQLTVHDIIPKLPFCRLIRELMNQYGAERIQGAALQGLQAAAEMYLVQLFEDSNHCTHHRKRATLMPPDMKLALMLRSRYDSTAADSL